MNKAGGKSQTAQANILGGRNPAFPRDHILALHCATVVSFKPFLPNVAYTQEGPNVYTSELGRNGLREISLSLSLSFTPWNRTYSVQSPPSPTGCFFKAKQMDEAASACQEPHCGRRRGSQQSGLAAVPRLGLGGREATAIR